MDEAVTQLRVSGHTAAEIQAATYDGRQRPAAVIERYARVDSTASREAVILSLEREDAQHPPLFYIMELAVVRTFGNSLISWRALSVLFGILAIPAAYALALELYGTRSAALIAASLFAVSPIERIYSEQAREYSLLTVLVLISTLALARAIRSPGWWPWAAYTLFTIASLYASPFSLYVVAAHAMAVLGSTRVSREFIATCFALIAALLAYIPWLYQLFVHRNDIVATNTWSGTHWPASRLIVKWIFNTGATFFDLEYLSIYFAIVLVITLLVATLAIASGFSAASLRARWLLGSAILVPALLLVTPDLLLAEHRSSVARYGLPVFAMLIMLAARGLVSRPLAYTGLIAASIASCVVGSLHASWWDNDYDADDVHLIAAVNSVPNAQLISTIAPAEFLTFSRVLDGKVLVSLTKDLATAEFSKRKPLFVLRPSVTDLKLLRAKTGLIFSPVPFQKAPTAHDIGLKIGGAGGSSIVNDSVDLYRSIDAAP